VSELLYQHLRRKQHKTLGAGCIIKIEWLLGYLLRDKEERAADDKVSSSFSLLHTYGWS
jgi:hypothetical protein